MCLEITDSQYPITFFTGTSTSRTAQECVAAKIQHTQKQEKGDTVMVPPASFRSSLLFSQTVGTGNAT
ncbi:MAG TPA: hypothetical protein DIU35_16800 [Candidatus Latescibacteria bacterium]|nr:hypothetical protein [Candidatus Latescibacterota bacterium]